MDVDEYCLFVLIVDELIDEDPCTFMLPKCYKEDLRLNMWQVIAFLADLTRNLKNPFEDPRKFSHIEHIMEFLRGPQHSCLDLFPEIDSGNC